MWPETQEIHLEFGSPVITEAQAGPTSETTCSQERAPRCELLIHASADLNERCSVLSNAKCARGPCVLSRTGEDEVPAYLEILVTD